MSNQVRVWVAKRMEAMLIELGDLLSAFRSAGLVLPSRSRSAQPIAPVKPLVGAPVFRCWARGQTERGLDGSDPRRCLSSDLLHGSWLPIFGSHLGRKASGGV